MYKELEKLGLNRVAQHNLAARLTKRSITRHDQLTEAEALEVWQHAARDAE